MLSSVTIHLWPFSSLLPSSSSLSAISSQSTFPKLLWKECRGSLYGQRFSADISSCPFPPNVRLFHHCISLECHQTRNYQAVFIVLRRVRSMVLNSFTSSSVFKFFQITCNNCSISCLRYEDKLYLRELQVENQAGDRSLNLYQIRNQPTLGRTPQHPHPQVTALHSLQLGSAQLVPLPLEKHQCLFQVITPL